MDYFNLSQQIRKAIEENSEILQLVEHTYSEEHEPFASGGTAHLYRVGRLPNGIHVALRSFGLYPDLAVRDFEDQILEMEHYCRNAERLFEKGEPVPKFCVGIVCGDNAGILTEDLTANGTCRLEHNPARPFGFIIDEKGSRKKVFIDVDGEFSKYDSDLSRRFFREKHRIQLINPGNIYK